MFPRVSGHLGGNADHRQHHETLTVWPPLATKVI